MCYEAVVVCELLLCCCCCWCSRSALTTERLKVSNGTERGWTRVRARKPSSTIVHTHTHTRATARNTMATTERQHSIGRQRKSARERALRRRRVSFPTQRAVWTVDCGPLCTGTARRHKLCCLLHTAKGIIWINSLWQLRVIPCCLPFITFCLTPFANLELNSPLFLALFIGGGVRHLFCIFISFTITNASLWLRFVSRVFDAHSISGSGWPMQCVRVHVCVCTCISVWVCVFPN